MFHIAGIAKSPSDLYSDLKSKLKKTPKGFLFEPVSSKLVSFRRPFRHVYEIFGGKPLIKGNYERERREFWVEKEFFFFYLFFKRNNRPFAAKPSRDLLFIKLWAATSRMPEMEKACRKHQNSQV